MGSLAGAVDVIDGAGWPNLYRLGESGYEGGDSKYHLIVFIKFSLGIKVVEDLAKSSKLGGQIPRRNTGMVVKLLSNTQWNYKLIKLVSLFIIRLTLLAWNRLLPM